MTPNAAESPSRETWRRKVWIVLALFAAVSLACRWLAIYTESINWDEFALLARAERTVRLGEVVGGGRPGLATLLLIPFVRNCTDSVIAVVHARIAWQVFTLGYLAGVFVLVRRWFVYSRNGSSGTLQATLAVVLLAFLPAFVTWSVQVRTDQPALVTATWGGVAMLGTGYVAAPIAGALFGVALLFSQKALYVVALGGLLWLTGTIARWSVDPASRAPEMRRQGLRFVLAILALALIILLYLQLVPDAARLASDEQLTSAADTMQWYRDRLGYRTYTVNAWRLVLHWFLLAVLAAATLRVIRRRERDGVWLMITAWAVLALGAMVVRVHGSSFPYFLMTAGLFPAVGLALVGRQSWVGNTSRLQVAVLLLAIASMALTAPETYAMLRGLQRDQRATMSVLKEAGIDETRRGYQVEGALFCSRDPNPVPAMFTQQIKQRFAGNPAARQRFIEEFRSRPVAFIVESYRMEQFPREITAFWTSHYLPYRDSILVAGFELGPAVNTIDVIVPAEYRWRPERAADTGLLLVGSRSVGPRETVWLDVGVHRVSTNARGTLLLGDLAERPIEPLRSFYDLRQLRQLRGFE